MIQTNKYSIFSHPNSVCLSYFKHMRVSLMLAAHFMWGASKAVVHAFFPNIYTRGSSDTVTVISNKLETIGCNRGMPNCPTLT